MEKSRNADQGIHDFDFFIGEWSVQNRRLKARFAGSSEWDEFPATARMHTILGGAGNVDEMHFPTKGYMGATLRLFNRQSGEWSLYWATDREGILQPPVVGRFQNGRGEFYGDDLDEGRPIRVRYTWSDITAWSARWQQAFSLDEGMSWETNWIMEMQRIDAPGRNPARFSQECCSIVELRQYTMKPGRRDDLIALFDEHFVEGQEQYEMKVIGQFRNLNDPSRFVWLRGFADMEARRGALDGFYNGPTWLEHRNAANDTMLDSSNVLLLKPAGRGAGLQMHGIARRALSNAQEEGEIIVVSIYYLLQGSRGDFTAFFESSIAPVLRSAGANLRGYFESAALENTFPRLPVREGESVFVWLASFSDPSAYAAHRAALKNSRAWNDSTIPALNKRVSKPTEVLELSPTSRSLLGH